MVKTDIYISNRQKSILSQFSKENDISFAELIRRALDEYIERRIEKDVRNAKNI